MIQDLLIIVNVAIGLLLAILEIKCWRTSCDPVRWTRLFYAVIGLYWAGLYLFMWFSRDRFDPTVFQVFVRPGITITLAAMASWSIIQARKHG